MGWLEWIGVGAGVLVLLAIIGYFIEKKVRSEFQPLKKQKANSFTLLAFILLLFVVN